MIDMQICVDANILLAVALEEPEKASIVKATSKAELFSPRVIHFEVGNALSSLSKRGLLTSEMCASIWDVVNKIPVTICEMNLKSALLLAFEHKIYAYDAYYLQCAREHGLELLTFDQRMHAIASKISVNLVELS